MKYLKRIRNFKDFYCAEFINGATTSCHYTACFFMVMTDKAVAPGDLESHIKLGEMVDPAHDWKEIRRIAGTFAKGAAA